MLGSTFSAWFQMLSKAGASGKRLLFTRPVDKKICALGLMAILALPEAALPAELNAGLYQVRAGWFQAVVHVWSGADGHPGAARVCVCES